MNQTDRRKLLDGRLVRRTAPGGGVVDVVERAAAVDGFDTESRQFTVIASDETVDRYGDVVDVKGWQLDNYSRNNVVLVDHSYKVEDIVGRGYPFVEGNALKMRVELDPPNLNRKAAIVSNLLETGSLRAVSVGFRPLDYELMLDDNGKPTGGVRFTRSELMEVSLVAVPANPSALIENGVREPDPGPASDTDEVNKPEEPTDEEIALARLKLRRSRAASSR